MSTPTRYPNGVTTASKEMNLGMFGLPDPTKWFSYWEDFNYFNAADWTITTAEAGAGSASEALGNGRNGVLNVINAAGDNDHDFLQKVGEHFRFASGKKMLFKAQFLITDATQSDFIMGLQITDTSPLAVSDGVYFQCDDGDAELDFHVVKDSTATTASNIATFADNTQTSVGFYYNGKTGDDGSVTYYVNDVAIGSVAITNLPDDEELTISFGIQNGEAVSKRMTIDYIFGARER